MHSKTMHTKTMHTNTMHNKWIHLAIMFLAMIIAGCFAGMNLFIDKLSDWRLNINDLYMSITMSGLMFIVMSAFYSELYMFVVGVVITVVGIVLARWQMFIGDAEYITSMIPHHSMAVLMSKALVERNHSLGDEVKVLAKSIIENQESEIKLMKKM